MLGFPILYSKGMRPRMFQLSGFYPMFQASELSFGFPFKGGVLRIR